MTPELKALWLAALRSGEYRQTRDTLKDKDGYCCLGVLCHVASEAKMLPSDIEIDEGPDELVATMQDEGFIREEPNELPPGAFGLSDNIITQCVNRNDGRNEWANKRQTFPAIADYLETALAEAAP